MRGGEGDGRGDGGGGKDEKKLLRRHKEQGKELVSVGGHSDLTLGMLMSEAAKSKDDKMVLNPEP